jgi:hypothetical protein
MTYLSRRIGALRARVNPLLPLIVGANVVVIAMVALDWLLQIVLHASRATALYLSILITLVALGIGYRWLLRRQSQSQGEKVEES